MTTAEKLLGGCTVLCKSGKFETGQGTCAAICMDQLGDARRSCTHVVEVHGELVRSILNAEPIRQPMPFDPASLGRLSKNQRAVVDVLLLQHVDYACLDFATIGHDAKLTRTRVKIACRMLARKGITEFHKGLSNEDGEMRGSGYCLTKAARKALEDTI